MTTSVTVSSSTLTNIWQFFLQILMCRPVSQDERTQVLSLLEEAPDTGP
jgi:hypothetical protein